MHDDSAYAANFVVRTLTPDAAAARSLDRTASIRMPSPLVRTRATSRNAATAMASSRHPSTGLGRPPLIAPRPAPDPTSTPRIVGSGTGDAEPPAPHVLLLKPNCSIATAAASVTTARDTPRTRSAEAPAAKPSAVAAATPQIAAGTNPRPASSVTCATVKPATPASATCTSDT